MVSFSIVRTAALFLAAAGSVLAHPAHRSEITHYGKKPGGFYSGAVATKDTLYVSGVVPVVNGTIPEGIEAQTTTVIELLTNVLEEAGTSWENAVKATVFLADEANYPGFNKIYGQLVPDPKPARTSAVAKHLPGPYLIELDLVAVIPRRHK